AFIGRSVAPSPGNGCVHVPDRHRAGRGGRVSRVVPDGQGRRVQPWVRIAVRVHQAHRRRAVPEVPGGRGDPEVVRRAAPVERGGGPLVHRGRRAGRCYGRHDVADGGEDPLLDDRHGEGRHDAPAGPGGDDVPGSIDAYGRVCLEIRPRVPVDPDVRGPRDAGVRGRVDRAGVGATGRGCGPAQLGAAPVGRAGRAPRPRASRLVRTL